MSADTLYCRHCNDIKMKKGILPGRKYEISSSIDIHNGKVKQIVGSSLQDEGNAAKENFVSEYDGQHLPGCIRMRVYRVDILSC